MIRLFVLQYAHHCPESGIEVHNPLTCQACKILFYRLENDKHLEEALGR